MIFHKKFAIIASIFLVGSLAVFQPCFAKITPKELEILNEAIKDIPIDGKALQEFITNYDDIRTWMINDIISPTGVKSTESCKLCMAIINIVIGLVRGGVPPLLIQSLATTACQILFVPNVFSYEVCLGVVDMYYEPLEYIFLNSEVKGLDVCGIYTGTEGGCDPINSTLTNWEILLQGTKPTIQEPELLDPSTPTVKFLHLTDIHPDLGYVVGSNNDCNEPMCCRGPVVSDPDKQAGVHGDWKCDMPRDAMLEVFETAANTYDDYAFVLMTGDLVHHKVWGTSKADNINHFNAVNTPLVQIFGNIPIYPIIGNHEPHPCNMFPPQSVWGVRDAFDLSWVYDTIADSYVSHLPADALVTFRKTGYYTVVIPNTGGLRLIAINTNFCYINNFWIFFETKDPEGQLQWLADTLYEAEVAEETVYIAGHIPPGKGDCWNVWSAKFHEIIIRFESTIKAQFYGHTHNDETTIFFDKSVDPPRPANTLNIGVSTTAYTHLNPGFKVFYADGTGDSPTWELMDHETWVYNLSDANLAGPNESPEWYRLYNMKEDFGLESLRPAHLYDMVLRMLDEDDLYLNYYRFFHKNSPFFQQPCLTQRCKLEFLCDVVKADSSDFSHCARLYDIVDGTTTGNPIPTVTTRTESPDPTEEENTVPIPTTTPENEFRSTTNNSVNFLGNIYLLILSVIIACIYS